MAEIAVALNGENDTLIIEQLDKKYEDIKHNIHTEQEKLKKIELAKNELLNGKNEIHYNISIKSVPGYQVLSLRKVIPDYYSEGGLWNELSEFAKQHRVELLSDTFSIYHDEDYREENVDVELCVVVSKAGKDIEPFKFRRTEPVPIME